MTSLDEARELALRALARRDLSRAALEARLRAAGVGPEAVAETVGFLVGAGLLDDGRLAGARAASLALRELGNAAINARLAAEGFGEDDRSAALAQLEPEAERARGVARRRAGDPGKLAAALYRRGFGQEAVEAALAALDAADGAELG